MTKAKANTPLGISVRTFNTLIDAGEAFKQTVHSVRPGDEQVERQLDLVLVKNVAGVDCPRFGVLAIDGPLFSPAENLDGFKNAIVLKGANPDEYEHMGKFVILQEPLAAGAIGWAAVSGITVGKVEMTEPTVFQLADVKDGDVTQLKGAGFGGAQILWREEGWGTKWALLRLGWCFGWT